MTQVVTATTVTFEVATVADAIKKASSIAPIRGAGMDAFMGIMIEVDPDNDSIEVRATDGAVYYTEWVDFVSAVGPAAKWRLPSKIVERFLSSLPITGGREVVFEPEDRGLTLTSGRSKLKLSSFIVNSGDGIVFPNWMAYEEKEMSSVPELGAKLKMVEWACSDLDPAMGVHLDGKRIYCTDLNKIVVVDCEIANLDAPITIPPGSISTLLKNIGDTRIRVEGKKVFVMPDDHSQIRAPVIDLPFKPVNRPMSTVFTHRVEFKRQALIDSINRVMTIKTKTDHSPILEIFIGLGEIATMVTEQETGLAGDVIDVPGYADHERVKLRLGCNHLLDVLGHAPNDLIEIGYNIDEAAPPIVYVNGRSTYEAWLPQIRGV